MTRFDLIGSLAKGGFYTGQWQIDDDVFDALSVQFIVQAWAAWVESLPDELKALRDVGGGKTVPVPQWVAEVWDCDNASRDFAVFIDRCAAVDAVKMGKPRGNVAAGIIKYFIGPDNAHARLWFVDYSGIAHSFDPADGQLDGLTQAQLESIYAGESI